MFFSSLNLEGIKQWLKQNTEGGKLFRFDAEKRQGF
jgi:hypothetical protein